MLFSRNPVCLLRKLRLIPISSTGVNLLAYIHSNFGALKTHSTMVSLHGRPLHYVFKIPDRDRTMDFYRKVLGMKVFRHEEFSEGCEAQCNGEYAGRWSKTMIGYGNEDDNFVIELTYNYGIHSYDRGNDFLGITIQDGEILKRAREFKWPIADGNILEAPGGYKYYIVDKDQPSDRDPVLNVMLASSSLEKSVNYWNGILGLTIYEKTDKSATFGFEKKATKIQLKDIGGPVDRRKAYGRIAFSIPYAEQEPVSDIITKNKQTILNPLMLLPTPGKQTVRVIILADPDGHEICFVEDEGYRKLSLPDFASEKVLDLQIKKDKS
ncbi:glyoxalase domain-containing protein 4 isoform X1 [Dendroctonus ponderosae]|uniref:VOC domain-containing protein n=3 Tax=Dendroctonus ponderosae TaxID=77166 RepID=J3JW56_DENPD|nr:glyoxalase domain-containing protein 4 isoform X1 [Dendroctonus ponderosae]AEE62436.1 unknown [Dendroctonus ponderosae]